MVGSERTKFDFKWVDKGQTNIVKRSLKQDA